MSSLRHALTTTLDNLNNRDFERFKKRVMEKCQITVVKLEEADRDDTIQAIIQKLGTEEEATQAVIEILTTMDLNHSANILKKVLNDNTFSKDLSQGKCFIFILSQLNKSLIIQQRNHEYTVAAIKGG